MCFPICRRGAAIAGVLSAITVAALPFHRVSAGVVAPSSDAETTEAAVVVGQPSPSRTESVPLPSPATPAAQQFWYPGMNDGDAGMEAIALSSVPIRSADGGTLAGAQQHPLIPLPMPAWTGMAGLLALAAVKIARNFRKILA